VACAELLQTQAFIDGELNGAEATDAERHIAGCVLCQAFCSDAAALSDDIRSYAPRFTAPDSLKLRVLDAIAAADEAAPQMRGRAWSWRRTIDQGAHAVRSRLFLGGFAGGVGLTGVAAALVLLAAPPLTQDTLADQIVRAHTEALMSGRTIAVVSSDHHTVKPWFAGKIDISPPVHDFAAEGFKLAGGRLDKVAGAPAAVVVYQHGLHEIDLFVWADRRQALPGGATRRGYNTLCWKQQDLDYAAVSDMQASELATFASLIRTAQE
jgi:anti-sigma factor RsiW